jgi:hypothetical protein
LIVGLGLVGCGNAAGNAGAFHPFANELSVSTGEFTAPVGESLTCFYTSTTTETELIVGDAAATQGSGGHHIIIYYTDVPRAPTSHPCVDAEMISWHQIGGASKGGEPVVQMPAGGAVKVPAGKQIVIQSHYINSSGAAETVNDSIAVQLVDPSSVKQYVNFWVNNDDTFTVAPASVGKSVSTCTFAQDLKMVVLLGHMHEYGAHFTLERVDAQGNTLAMVYDQAWQPLYATHPPLLTTTLDQPMDIPAGTIYRQTCTWDNTTPNPLAFPIEMCVTFGYYYPDNGFLSCNTQHVP